MNAVEIKSIRKICNDIVIQERLERGCSDKNRKGYVEMVWTHE